MAATGARASEILNLRGADIDRGSSEIIIRSHKTDTTVGIKTIAVPGALIAQLPTRAADDLLFPKVRTAYRDDRPTVPRVTLNVLRTALVACGIDDENVDQHSLRRTWITLSLRMGVPMAVSMQQTGHQSPNIHLVYQRNASSDAAHDAVEALWARLWAGSPHPQAAEPLKSSEFPLRFAVPASC